MRYVRTENWIYDIETTAIVYVDGVPCVEFWTDRFTSTYKKIITQADNIKELCDKFVITFNDKSLEPKEFKNFETALEFLKECDIKYNPELKGAIWTYKGLIYVAKTNSIDELELI